ncbi:MAG: glycosyltransferase family 4 protein [Deltaproteobacteria bacterium]|nr:glycosyltransferase family 4 protein [Deltaproteobacteria bacterium]
MKNTHKILFVNANSGWAGGEINLFTILEHLDKNLRPILLSPSEGPLVDNARAANIANIIISMHYLTKKTSPLKYLRTVQEVIKVIKENSIDLVYVNDLFANQFSLPAAKLSRVPILCHVRVPITRKHLITNCINFSDMIVCTSKSVSNVFPRRFKKKSKMKVIYSGVDIEKFDFKKGSFFRNAFNLDTKDFVVAVVGSIEPRKGQDYFIRSAPDILKKINNVKFIIAGKTVAENKLYASKLLCLVDDLKLQNNVIFTGFIKNIPDLMNSIDLLVLPSLEEAFGRVLIEAMATRKPIVATKVDGILEAVIDKQTGILVPPKDPGALAEAIVYLLKNPVIAKKMGEEGRKRVERFFRIEETSKEINDILLELLRKKT